MRLVDSNPVPRRRVTKHPAKLRVPTTKEVRRLIDGASRMASADPPRGEHGLPTVRTPRTDVQVAVDLDGGRIVDQKHRAAGRREARPAGTEDSQARGRCRWWRRRSRRSVSTGPEQAQRLLALGIRQDDETPVLDRGDGTPLDPDTFTHTIPHSSQRRSDSTACGCTISGTRTPTTIAASGAGLAVTQRLGSLVGRIHGERLHAFPDEEALAQQQTVAQALG